MASKSRNTDIAKVIEYFLDNNEGDISTNLFNLLEDVAAEIDDMAKAKDDELEELQDRIKELETELEELQA